MNEGQQLSERAKHRLRIVARFLRLAGYRFDSGNFYHRVIEVIGGIDEQKRKKLQGYVDWLEAYETAEANMYGNPPCSRTRKSNIKSGKRGALRQAPSGAKPEQVLKEY